MALSKNDKLSGLTEKETSKQNDPNVSDKDDASATDIERRASSAGESTSSGSNHNEHEVIDAVELERIASIKQNPINVARRSRRGFLAKLTIVPEITNPYDYSNKLKWSLTAVVACAAAAAPVGSAIMLPCLYQVTDEFHATEAITNLTVALYMLSMAIFPLWWSSFSETSGRRTIYLISFALYIIFSALSAISNSIAMLIVMRMLAGGAAASVQAVGAGTIADLWHVRERGKAMSTFYLGPLCGPLLAPIVGGALGEAFNWRATQWAQVVFGGLIWIFLLFGLPETLKSTKNLVDEKNNGDRPTLTRTSTRQSVQQKSKRGFKILKKMFIDPLMVIQYLRFPAVFLTVYCATVTFASLYVLNISIQYTFEMAPYNYTTLILGLLYIPNSLGYFLSSIFGGKWIDSIMRREAIKANRVSEDGKLIYRPEDRMRENAWLGIVIFPAALIWYGWSVEHGVFWLVPMIANFFFGVGSMLIFALATTMLTEFMPKKSSSGVALNNLCRNIFSCVGAIVGVPVIQGIGNGWLFTILGLWSFFSGCAVIWAMRRYGDHWRKRMDAQLA